MYYTIKGRLNSDDQQVNKSTYTMNQQNEQLFLTSNHYWRHNDNIVITYN